MEQYADVVIDLEGNAIQGATVQIFAGAPNAWLQKDFTTPVKLYDSNGTAQDAVVTDARGAFAFQAPNGKYVLQVKVRGTIYATIGPRLFYDPADDDDRLTVAELGSSSGATLVGTPDGALSLVLSAGLRISVKRFGAVGDGVADDTAAIQAAINALTLIGGDLFLPRGFYRVTNTLQIGLPYYDSYEFIINRTAPVSETAEADRTLVANKESNKSKKKIGLMGETGTYLVADFSPANFTPVLAYNLDNDGPDSTGVVSSISIITKNQYSNKNFILTSYAPNKLIGLYVGRGSKVNSNMFFAGLGVGVVSSRSYWCAFRDMVAARCGDAFHFSDANASDINNLNAVECKRGYNYNAQVGTFANIHTENVDEDVWIISADACKFGPMYLEDVRSSGGQGLYMLKLGYVQNGFNITHSGFNQINTLSVAGSSKKSIRMWSLANATFNTCRAYGSAVEADNNSYATLIGCDFASPNSNVLPVSTYSTGVWTPAMSDSFGNSYVADPAYTSGFWTKSNNVVTLFFSYAWTSIGQADGSPLLLSGIPFPAKNAPNLAQAVTIGDINGFDSGSPASQIIAEITQPTLKYITFKRVNDNATSTPLPANAQSPTGKVVGQMTLIVD